MLIFLKNTPFVRLFVFTFLGVLISKFFSTPYVFLLLFLLLVCLTICYAKISKSVYYDTLWGILFNISCVVTGIAITHTAPKQFDLPDYNQKKIFSTTIEQYDGCKNGRQQYTGKLRVFDNSSVETNKIKIKISIDSTSSPFKVGDVILCNGFIRKILNRNNPGEFNYQKWANKKNIYYNSYLRHEDCSFVQHIEPPFATKWINDLQDFLIRKFEESKIEGDELSVLVAMITGDKRSLSAEVRDAFSIAGLMHILAVSGLHIGIIYLILARLTKPLTFVRYGKKLRIVTILTGLWLYATFTGLAPSVLRAVLMFSLLVIGEFSGRKYASVNALFASAFILLLFDSDIVFELGFQLSYLAVLGILFLYKPIYDLLYFKNKILDYIWGLCAISIAAQIATSPVCLFYFNRFPTYFIISNLLIVPLAGVLMNGVVVFITVSFIPFISKWIGMGINYILKFINWHNSVITSLPYSDLSDIFIDTTTMVGLFALIILFFVALKKRTFASTGSFSIVLFALISFNFAKKEIIKKQSDLHIFNSNKQVLALINNSKMYTFTIDSSLNTAQLKHQLSSHYKRDIKQITNNISKLPTVWKYNNNLLLFMGEYTADETQINELAFFDIIIGQKRLELPVGQQFATRQKHDYTKKETLWLDPSKGHFKLNIKNNPQIKVR